MERKEKTRKGGFFSPSAFPPKWTVGRRTFEEGRGAVGTVGSRTILYRRGSKKRRSKEPRVLFLCEEGEMT